MNDYESLFQVPKCNYKRDMYGLQYNPKLAPSLHRDYDRCPLHSKDDTRWADWAAYRECYTKAVDEENAAYFMDHMLECVTETIPPLSEPEPATRLKTWHDIDGRPHSYPASRKRPSDARILTLSLIAFLLVFTCFIAIFL